mgnify:CR=1 FL=1
MVKNKIESHISVKIEYSILIQRGGGTGPMKPDNRHSHSNAAVSIPAEFLF